ncbi:MAG: recombinase family protein [Rhodobacteraceae bacterium]|nr:recombinase family protein [Paracoccaceae bacterium]
MLIGYARISTADQNLDHLHDALHAAECQKIFDDTISGARAERPGLARVFDHLRGGGGGLYGIEGDDSARMEVGYSQVD